ASQIKASKGFVAFLWYIAYGIPYLVGIVGFIILYEWIRAKFHE
ncbi:DUF334 domain-containing protein, partial [Staphylococcus aureus]|nr:DUF334 domain-containing protein [Staphylococcus aureus]